MINTLKTLCALSGVSSFEDEVRDYIRQRVTPYATDLRVDAMGNLIVLKKGARATGNKLMLCAHMDEVGLIIKSITEDGVKPRIRSPFLRAQTQRSIPMICS